MDLHGKNGKLLREQKRQNTVYTFTREQLIAHDNEVVRARIATLEAVLADREAKHREEMEQVYAEYNKKMQEAINAEWKARKAAFMTEDFESNMLEFVRIAVMIPLRILVEKFGWKKVPENAKTGDGRYRLVKLHDYIAETLNALTADDLQDIRAYAAEAEKVTGIYFELLEEGGGTDEGI